MSRIREICKFCKREFTTYWPEGYKAFCCLGCERDWHHLDCLDWISEVDEIEEDKNEN